jgi:hypothetical protein
MQLVLLWTFSRQSAPHPTQPPTVWIPGAVSSEVKQPGPKASAYLHLLPRSRMLELELHSPIRLHGVQLN